MPPQRGTLVSPNAISALVYFVVSIRAGGLVLQPWRGLLRAILTPSTHPSPLDIQSSHLCDKGLIQLFEETVLHIGLAYGLCLKK